MSTALAHALNAALRDSMEADDKVLLIGEDIGELGGVFRVTDGLAKDFGEDRVVTSPLGEAGIVGSAIGLAMAGYRPVCEIQFDGFVFPAMNQIITQLAKYRHRSEGAVSLPVVIRIPVGGGIGAIEHHSESPEAYFAHTPGLRVLCPSSAQDAYDLLGQAIGCNDPVIFLEPKRSYWAKGDVDTTATPLPIDQARVVRPGADLTLVTYGALVPTAVKAAAAAAEEGRSIEVIDLRSLSPIDDATIVASVERTGRLIVAHEASQTAGLGSEIAARVQDQAFYSLEAPIIRVTGYDTPYPASRLEHDWLPSLDRILDAVDRSFTY
ncbi:alpha-ketoacid dehydrogenase subunit beta [Nocardioides albus]|uniref:Pyruvate dehydrogenase E1 component beta subunit n=1 Tax=Nocardioides albus TaxID=1841 RepID=A0A7W5A4U2_9ACTN|nr:alpha-ketoacid dehydrogenase subunit beta [Nocardioides albus]MBB3089722.1 pyruvate dehydrogenase E1 component beta subunit [Nocardioides albus]GGU35133.1 pyruvate dehydrogenase E1 component beta subunit [Nocardioides albus]